jgi:hypothetical protein
MRCRLATLAVPPRDPRPVAELRDLFPVDVQRHIGARDDLYGFGDRVVDCFVNNPVLVVRQGGDLGGGVEVTDGVLLPQDDLLEEQGFGVDPGERVLEIATKLVVEKPGA